MRKLIASIIALISANASAYDVTNTVTIVSNIYNRISEEHWITNNIKNTHSNYYYTNNVYIVSNVTLLVSQQTFKTNTTVSLDVSQQAIAEARSQANRAERIATNALDFANAAANSATTAQSHAADAKDYRDEAEYYAEQAHGQVQPIIDEGQRQLAAVQAAGNTQTGRVTSEGNYQVGRVNSAGSSNVGSVNSAGTTALNNITAKQQWFDQHFGQMVTNVNIYHDEDIVARAGVATLSNRFDELNVKIDNVTPSMLALRAVGGKWTVYLSTRNSYSEEYLLEKITVDSVNYTEEYYDGYDVYNYPFTVQVFMAHQNSPWVKKFYKRKSDNLLRVLAGSGSTFSTRSFESTSDPHYLTGWYYGWYSGLNAYLVFERYPPMYVKQYLSADLNIYDANTNKIDNLILKSEFDNFKNYVEDTFQKK